jgi:DNA-directed RNA polymerase subunit RPC12/RpoP
MRCASNRSLSGKTKGMSDERTTINCPHCKKAFEGDLLAGTAERYRGFKCPHCRLFVPAART